jgi:hypothetical protein
MPNSDCAFPGVSLQHSTIRPIGVYALSGLAVDSNQLLAVDAVRGYLLAVNPRTNNTTVLNPHHVSGWIGVNGLTLWQEMFWFTKGQEVLYCDRHTLIPTVFTRLPYPVTGVAVWETTVYVSCQKSGYIHLFDRDSGEPLERIPQPGVGTETLTVFKNNLWVCDRAEQTVYCLDLTTGAIQFSALTPFPSPTGIAFYASEPDQEPICYVAYADEEPYIRDNPNAEFPYQITFRDRTFIHPLHIHYNASEHYTLSNGYLVELSYVEELLPLEAVTLNQVEWRIALPSDTLRQRIRHIEPIGHEFTIEEQAGQKVAVFKFDRVHPHQGGLLGWKAIVEMYGLKYSLAPTDITDGLLLPEELQPYLMDDDDLAMETDTIKQAAQEAIGTETNVLRQMLKIRNYVYDRLSYGIRPKIDTPDVALARGVGSCGEYVGVLLALARLNGIACRTIGRYKWLPMESNVDDTVDRGPYPQRFFMGLSWYHTEIGKGISFEKMKAADKPAHISMGDLAINHIRFRILEELIPQKFYA